jgi:hypothetical protein
MALMVLSGPRGSRYRSFRGRFVGFWETKGAGDETFSAFDTASRLCRRVDLHDVRGSTARRSNQGRQTGAGGPQDRGGQDEGSQSVDGGAGCVGRRRSGLASTPSVAATQSEATKQHRKLGVKIDPSGPDLSSRQRGERHGSVRLCERSYNRVCERDGGRPHTRRAGPSRNR